MCNYIITCFFVHYFDYKCIHVSYIFIWLYVSKLFINSRLQIILDIKKKSDTVLLVQLPSSHSVMWKLHKFAVAKQLYNCILNPIALINYITGAIHAGMCNTYVNFTSYLPVLDPLSMCDMSTISSGSMTPLKGVRHSTPGKAGWNKVGGHVSSRLTLLFPVN